MDIDKDHCTPQYRNMLNNKMMLINHLYHLYQLRNKNHLKYLKQLVIIYH
jgi:hypothetical protein